MNIILFFLLAFLCYQAHQWVRHLSGALLCAGPGSMTFTAATMQGPCSLHPLIDLSGPLLTYGLAYLGMILLLMARVSLPAARCAYALVFASFAHLRFIQTLTGCGDELVLAQDWLQITSRPLVAGVVFLIGLPPVIAAYGAIANRRRRRVFVISWLLPLPLLFVLLFGDKFLFETSQLGTRLGMLGGVWVSVLVTELIALLLLIFGLRGKEDGA